MGHALNSSTQEKDTGKSQVPSQPGLNREFQVSWGYTVRLSLCETGRGGGRGKSLVEGWRDGSKYYCSRKSRFSFQRLCLMAHNGM